MRSAWALVSVVGVAVLVAAVASPARAEGPAVTFESLLGEMVDRDRLARWPEVAYRCRLASSYDRASVAPDKPGWFANNDTGQSIRTETIQGRKEFVAMDVDGPGAIVRFWKGGEAPATVVRIYLDGSDTPAIEEKAEAFLGGAGWARPPLAATRARGFNFYLPIPYAKHCKVTFDQRGPDWYNIEYRTYPAGTAVRTFTRADHAAAAALLERVGQTLLAPANTLEAVTKTVPARFQRLEPGAAMEAKLDGPAAIRLLRVGLSAEDLPQALRSTVLAIEFDGEPAVWCPVGDFFGSGIGLNPYRDWYREVDRSGMMTCYWIMPFRKSCRIELRNLGGRSVGATLGMIGTSDWKWDDRSMYFHAAWRQQWPIETRKSDGTMDWNYVEIRGQGVYLGDTLALYNGAAAWWGEGDEKIFVDGEAFPSFFGTGSEDYYGYSWGNPAFFEAPFHAQPRFEGNDKVGYTTDTRTRDLDAIPFASSLKVDLEVWHWAATRVAYAAAPYWYARPGATCNRPPQPQEAARLIPPNEPGRIEGETMTIRAKTGGITETQSEGRWSGGRQLWWRDGKPGDKLELVLPVAKAGRYALVMRNTRAFDYGVFQFTLDGEKLGGPIDLFSKENTDKLVAWDARELTAGDHVFAAEIVGANPEAAKRYMLGLDYLGLEPPK